MPAGSQFMSSEEKERLILVAEGEPEIRGYLEMALRCEGHSVEAVADGEEALNCFAIGMPISAVLLDVMLPGRDGLEVLREIRARGCNVPVIVISGAPSPGLVVEAMRIGANDFLGKPITHESLRRSLKGVFGGDEQELLQAAGPAPPGPLYFGFSPAMRELQTMVKLVARSETPVLIQGETGSGKEMLARHVHANSPRAQRPFVKLNCAALPSELVESELFGYERGAFTGAFQRKIGMFEIADGGTLLLDEIGDMDFKLQAKLLQVLQDHEFQRLGGKETVRVDVRVIAATHNDLERSIAAGTFRQDLYYRLNVVTLHVPPLRDRKEDIVPLADFLLDKHSPDDLAPEITPALQQALLLHDWPGNVRELENVIRKLTVIRDPGTIAQELNARAARKTMPAQPVSDLSVRPDPLPGTAPILEQVTRAKQQAETEAILAALNTTHWNRKKAAALLKIDYKALLYKMKKLGVDGSPAMDFARAVGAEINPS
jgi:two-component system, NtrC family, response regulator AtoC